jgi:hypothetical protein
MANAINRGRDITARKQPLLSRIQQFVECRANLRRKVMLKFLKDKRSFEGIVEPFHCHDSRFL